MIGLVGMSGLDGAHRSATGELTLVHLDALPLEECLYFRIVALDDGSRREADDPAHLIGCEGLYKLLHAPVYDGRIDGGSEVECVNVLRDGLLDGLGGHAQFL